MSMPPQLWLALLLGMLLLPQIEQGQLCWQLQLPLLPQWLRHRRAWALQWLM